MDRRNASGGGSGAAGGVGTPTSKLNPIGSIAAHPCKERKDGAPSDEMAHTEHRSKGGPPAMKN